MGGGLGIFYISVFSFRTGRAFTSSPNSQFCLEFTGCPGLGTTVPVPPEHQGNGELTGTWLLSQYLTLGDQLGVKGSLLCSWNPPGQVPWLWGEEAGEPCSLRTAASTLPSTPLTPGWASPGPHFPLLLQHSASQG